MAELGAGVSALRQAMQACRAAQSLGRAGMQVYQKQMAAKYGAGNDGWMLNRLTHALKNDGLELYAQLISPLGADREAGAPLLHMHELLLRLRDEDGEICSACMFLPIAARYGLSPERICFEITETAAITDIAATKEFVEALRRIGYQFALDDFGSGHSSFLYLRDLPVDYLKMDGELVREIVDDPVSLAFVRTIEGIGRLMGRRTIAEYVESQEIYNAIGAIGCDYAQGYWAGCPVPLADVLSKPRS